MNYTYEKIKNPDGTVCENIIYRSDKTYIPFDPDNRQYAEYLDWLAQGNEPTVRE